MSSKVLHRPVHREYLDRMNLNMVKDVRQHIYDTHFYRQAFELYGTDSTKYDTILKFYVDRYKRENKNYKKQEEWFYVAYTTEEEHGSEFFDWYEYKKILEYKYYTCDFWVMPSTSWKHARNQVTFFVPYKLVPEKRFKTYEKAKEFADACAEKNKQAIEQYKARKSEEFKKTFKEKIKLTLIDEAVNNNIQLPEYEWVPNDWEHYCKEQGLPLENSDWPSPIYHEHYDKYSEWQEQKRRKQHAEKAKVNKKRFEKVIQILGVFGCKVCLSKCDLIIGRIVFKKPNDKRKWVYFSNSGTIQFRNMFKGINDLVLLISGVIEDPYDMNNVAVEYGD